LVSRLHVAVVGTPSPSPCAWGRVSVLTCMKGVMTDASETWLAQAALLDRGWTVAGIRRFLGDPDATKPNPRYRSASPMRLWAIDRVEAAEATPEWARWVKASEVRRQAGLKVADRKRAELAAMVKAVHISIAPATLEMATARAIRSFNDRAATRAYGDYDPATPDSDPAFLARITVNYLRHERTSYDALGAQLFGLVGREEAHDLLRERVLAAIADAYPSLAAECATQVRQAAEQAHLRW